MKISEYLTEMGHEITTEMGHVFMVIFASDIQSKLLFLGAKGLF